MWIILKTELIIGGSSTGSGSTNGIISEQTGVSSESNYFNSIFGGFEIDET